MSEAKITVRGKISSLLIRLDRLHWLWLALAAPFLLFPSSWRSLAMLVVPAVWLLHWFVVSWEQRATRRRVSLEGHGQRSAFRLLLSALPPSAIPLTPLNGTLLLMATMVLVSLWATFDIAFSLPKISGMVLGFGVFFAVVREAEHPHGWILSVLAFLGLGFGIAILGIFGTSWFSSKITLFDLITARLPKYITGLQGAESGFHPNEVAGALIWVLPLMMAISVALFFLQRPPENGDAMTQRKDWQDKMRGWRLIGVTILSLAATFFVAAVFLLCQSRSGYIGLALTLPMLILIALPPRWRWYSLALLVLLAVFFGILLAPHWEATRVWVTGNLAANPAFSLQDLETRLVLWSRALYGIQDFPFTGMGMNAFRKVLPMQYPILLLSDMDYGHAHNEFLQAALDLGIPGLIAFIALYIGAFWMLTDIWKTTRPPHLITDHYSLFSVPCSLVTRSLTLGLGGGLLAHLLYGLTDAVALGAKPGVLFWMLLGLIAGLHRQAQDYWAVVDNSVPTTGAENGLCE
ncbi:O-antigen ligase domain-containing protein [bacterium]|nr:MAG: O-antigen ligase domain-containing protein [bacterium]